MRVGGSRLLMVSFDLAKREDRVVEAYRGVRFVLVERFALWRSSEGGRYWTGDDRARQGRRRTQICKTLAMLAKGNRARQVSIKTERRVGNFS